MTMDVESAASALSECEGGVRVTIRVKPRARRQGLCGMRGRALEIALTAPPVDGAANSALFSWLSETFGVSRSRLSIVSGPTSREKCVELHGISLASAERALAVAVKGDR